MVETKPYIVIGTLKDLSNSEWLQKRCEGIGGSDAAAILGYSKYGTPLTKWMEKTGRLKKKASGEAIEVGNILEGPIRREVLPDYLKKRGDYYEIIESGYMLRSALYPWMIGNLDGEIKLNGKLMGLEIKTGSSYVLKDWGGKDGNEIPDAYYCQVQHYMAITGHEAFLVFGLIGNTRVLRIIERDEEFIGELVSREKLFWDLVQQNDPGSAPLPTGKDCDMEAILELGNPQNETVATLTQHDEMLQRYMGVCEDIKNLEAEKKQMYQELIRAMGQSKFGETTEYKLTLSRFNTSRLDTKKIKTEHPEIYANYCNESEQARLYIKSGGTK